MKFWNDFRERNVDKNSFSYGVCTVVSIMFSIDYFFDGNPLRILCAIGFAFYGKFFHSKIDLIKKAKECA